MRVFQSTLGLSAFAVLMFPLSAASAPARRNSAPHIPSRRVASRLVRLTPASSHTGKPEAPVTIRLIPGEVRGNRQTARLVVTPLVEGARLEIAVIADEGLALLNSKGRWSVLARREVAFTTDLLLAAVAEPSGRGEQELLITATLVFPGDQAENPRQTAVAAWVARPRQVSLVESHPGSRRVKTPNGRRILEIPGETH